MLAKRHVLGALLLMLALPERASAADRVQECIGEHVEAQLLRNQGRLVSARARLAQCANPVCPALVRDECEALEREVEAALPSVVLSALDADGDPTAEPLVSIDGSTKPIALDGRPIALDPGEHWLHFQHPDGGVRDVTVTLVESEHLRSVVADFRPAPGSSARADRRWRNVTFASAGVAALALGSFTYFGLSGHSVQNELEECKPDCENRADVDRMRSRYLVADLSLGVALVSVGVGVYAWLQQGPSAPSAVPTQASNRGIRLEPIAGPRQVGLWATGEF